MSDEKKDGLDKPGKYDDIQDIVESALESDAFDDSINDSQITIGDSENISSDSEYSYNDPEDTDEDSDDDSEDTNDDDSEDTNDDSDDTNDDTGTFATEEAPWVGAEENWRQGESDSHLMRKKQSLTPKPPAKEDEEDLDFLPKVDLLDGVILPQTVSLLPSVMPEKRHGKSSKIAMFAIILSVIVMGSAIAWWASSEKNESEKARKTADSYSQELSAREAKIKELESKLSSLSASETPENKQLANELMAEIESTKTEPIVPPEPEQIDTAEQVSVAGVKPWQRPKNDTESPDTSSSLAQPAEEEAVTEEETADTSTSDIDEDPYGDNAEAPNPDSQNTAPVASTDAMSDLLDNAVAPPTPTNTEEQPQQNSLPDSANSLPKLPTREQVKSTMDAVASAVKRCAGESGGRIIVKMAVNGPTGRVISAEPASAVFAGTPTGICAARAVKLAKFPKFTQNNLVIKYPFDL